MSIVRNTESDLEFENKIRPQELETFSGQDKIVDNLPASSSRRRSCAATRSTTYCCTALRDLAKTTLANIISNEMNAQLRVTSGPVLDKPGDLAGLLTSLDRRATCSSSTKSTGSVRSWRSISTRRMEDYKIDIVLDKGPAARSIQIELAPFTLRRRHHAQRPADLVPCGRASASSVIWNTTTLRCWPASSNARRAFWTSRSTTTRRTRWRSARRGTPRIANALLRRVRDFAMVKGEGHIDLEITQIGLAALNIDSRGLDQMDNKILGTIIEKFGGGPVGLNTIATAVGEDAGTIEEVYEPFLIKEGFLKRTPRGREATELAYRHMGFTPPGGSDTLLF